MVRAVNEADDIRPPLQARGGELGGAGTPTGERVVVRFDGSAVDVFHETGSLRFHPELIDKIALQESPAPTGEALVVTAARHGCQIPVRFESSERQALERIIAAVRAVR
jgi:hypothetical protein